MHSVAVRRPDDKVRDVAGCLRVQQIGGGGGVRRESVVPNIANHADNFSQGLIRPCLNP